MGNDVVLHVVIAMLDERQSEQVFNVISELAAWCRDDYWRDELIQHATLSVVTEQVADIPTAYALAVRHVRTAQRYERGELSLDEQVEVYGDGLRVEPMDCPAIRPGTIQQERYKQKGKQTPRQPQKRIGELGVEDRATFYAVLRNDYQRRILPEIEDVAVDIALLPCREAELLRLILSSATKAELRERGYRESEISGATHWLTVYYTPRSRVAPRTSL